jgi:hypothetical protein
VQGSLRQRTASTARNKSTKAPGASGVQQLHQGSVSDSVAVQLQFVLPRQLPAGADAWDVCNLHMETWLWKLLEEHVGGKLEGLILSIKWRDNLHHQHQ